MLHLVYGMNSPLISASLVRHSLLHFLLSHIAFYLHRLHYHHLNLLLLAQYFILNSNLALQQVLSSIDLFLSYRTNYTDSRTILFCSTAGLVSRLLVGFRVHFKSLHFHSFVVNLYCSYCCSSC